MSVQFLIADRDPRVREECRRYLNARGYSAAVAANDLQCLEQVQQRMPSVLVLDAELLRNGSEGLLEWLTSWQSPKRVVVLVTDGQSTRPLREQLRSLVAGRLARPQTLHEVEQFISQLHELLDDDHVDDMTADTLTADPLAVARVYQ